MIRCPSCGSRTVGRVATSQYFCGDCCVEFELTRNGSRVFTLNEDGTLVSAGASNDKPISASIKE